MESLMLFHCCSLFPECLDVICGRLLGKGKAGGLLRVLGFKKVELLICLQLCVYSCCNDLHWY